MRLSLPGLSELELRDMVNIRSDESFGVFRSDIAAAMTDADADIERGALDMAIRTVAEHMDAGSAKLNATTKKGLLKEATVPDLVGWGVGAAAATSVEGWKGFVATLLGKQPPMLSTSSDQPLVSEPCGLITLSWGRVPRNLRRVRPSPLRRRRTFGKCIRTARKGGKGFSNDCVRIRRDGRPRPRIGR